MAIKNLLFDIGGVVINLYPERTKAAFEELGLIHQDSWFKGKEQSETLSAFETGKISAAEFISENNRLAQTDFSEAEFSAAWNAMLGEAPQERIQFIEELKKNFRVFALSNINPIHEKACDVIFAQHQYPSMAALFEQAFYSHHIHQRKPFAEAYLHVLDAAGIKSEETLFFDDLPDNIETAKSVGIKAYQVKHNTIETVLKALEENQTLS